MTNPVLDGQEIKASILTWPCLYQTETGRKFIGIPVSELPNHMRACGWHNVSYLKDESELKKYGLEIVTARYVGGARPKRFCRVVVAE